MASGALGSALRRTQLRQRLREVCSRKVRVKGDLARWEADWSARLDSMNLSWFSPSKGWLSRYSSISSARRARWELAFHAAANSSGLRGVLPSMSGRTMRSWWLVMEVRKSAVVCCSGQTKPRFSK